MVNEVNAIPHEQVYKRGESVADNDLGLSKTPFLLTPDIKDPGQ